MRVKGSAVLIVAGLLSACGLRGEEDADVPEQDPEPVAGGIVSEACSGTDADTGELLPMGRLVQLNVKLRYEATRDTKRVGDGTSYTTSAKSLVQGTSSQLACVEEQYGYLQFFLEPYRSEALGPFPVVSEGTASLEAKSVLQVEGTTMREEDDFKGSLERLEVEFVTARDDTNADEVCVGVGFKAPLTGSSTTTGPGVGSRRNDGPVVVGDSYSAMAVRTFGEGDHAFAKRGVTVCAGPTPAEPSIQGNNPMRLEISTDGKVWTRSGEWIGHLSGPNETRTVDFRMEIVPPTLQMGPAPADTE